MDIEQDILEDFNTTLLSNGYRGEDFELSQEEITPNSVIYNINAEVTVKNKKNGKQKKYYSGTNNTWLEEFEVDLKTGLFN